MIPLEALVKFIVDNREGTQAFKNWSEDDIKRTLVECMKLNGAAITIDQDGNLTGIVMGIPDAFTKVLNIKGILIKKGNPNVLRTMIALFKDRFHGYNIITKRNDIMITLRARQINLLERVSV